MATDNSAQTATVQVNGILRRRGEFNSIATRTSRICLDRVGFRQLPEFSVIALGQLPLLKLSLHPKSILAKLTFSVCAILLRFHDFN